MPILKMTVGLNVCNGRLENKSSEKAWMSATLMKLTACSTLSRWILLKNTNHLHYNIYHSHANDTREEWEAQSEARLHSSSGIKLIESPCELDVLDCHKTRHQCKLYVKRQKSRRLINKDHPADTKRWINIDLTLVQCHYHLQKSCTPHKWPWIVLEVEKVATAVKWKPLKKLN